MSPAFGNFVKAKRPKYYADKTLKPSNSITPVATLLKYFTAEFIMNFDAFYKAEEKECFSVLGYAILNFIEALKYPAALKKFEKEKFGNEEFKNNFNDYFSIIRGSFCIRRTLKKR